MSGECAQGGSKRQEGAAERWVWMPEVRKSLHFLEGFRKGRLLSPPQEVQRTSER